MANPASSTEWLGAYRAPAVLLLHALRGALVANAATRGAIVLGADAAGATIGGRAVRGAYSADALQFGAPALSYAAAQALAAWLARRGADVVSVARTADALRFSAHGADAWLDVELEAPAPAAAPRAENRLQALQREARQLGISWADVRAVARDLAERDATEGADALRARAAQLLGVRGAWRRGLQLLQRRLDRTGRDVASVAGWDDVAATLREEFPQYSGHDSGDLFALVTEATAPAAPADYYAEALGWIESHGALVGDVSDLADVPF
jgi:hypothetical protein